MDKKYGNIFCANQPSATLSQLANARSLCDWLRHCCRMGRAFVDIEVIVLLLQHLSVKAFRTILRYQSGRYCVNSGVACDSVWESLLHFLIRDIEVKELSFETGISKNHWQSLKSSCKRLCIRYRGENLLHQRVTFLSEA